MSRRRLFASASKRNRLRKATVHKVTLERLERRELLAADLGVIDEGLQSGFLAGVQAEVNRDILSVPAPFVGTALAENITDGTTSNQFLTGFQNKLYSLDIASGATIAEVKTQLATTLEIDESAIVVTGDDDDSEIRFDVTLTGAISQAGAVGLELVGADPELELLLGTDGQVNLNLAMSYELAFVISEDANGVSSFSLDTSSTDELTIDYTARIREDFDSGKGRIGVFVADFSESQHKVSEYSGSYTLNVEQATSGAPEVSGLLIGSGGAYLDIEASFFPNIDLPTDLINLGVTAEGSVEYNTLINFSGGEVSSAGNEITVGLGDVAIDVGKIYSDFVDPLVRRLQDNLKPLQPIVDFVLEPIPVISDVMEMAGRGPINALGLAGIGPNDPAAIAVRVVDAILNYQGLAGLNSENIQSLFDLEYEKIDYDPDEIKDRKSEVQKNIDDLRTGKLVPKLDDVLQTPEGQAEFEREMSWGAEFEGAFELPFLSDIDILAGYLMGDTSGELMTFGVTGAFEIGGSVSVPIAPLLNLVQLNAGLTVGLGFDLHAGYDAYGIAQLTEVADFSSEEALQQSLEDNTLLLVNGFYMDDQNELANNVGVGENSDSDAPEASLTVRVTGGVSGGVDLGVASATIGGALFLEGTLELDLNDLPDSDVSVVNWPDTLSPLWTPEYLDSPEQWNYDGRIRVPELVTIVEENPLAVTNINGSLAAGLEASIQIKTLFVTLVDMSWELFRITLVDGTLFEADDAELLLNANQSQLGEVVDGQLRLFVGPDAVRRTDAAPTVEDERITIRSLGASRDGGETTLVVLETPQGDKHSRIFKGVTSIVGNTGSGNDFVNVVSGVTSDVTLYGGEGDDQFVVDSTGVATLYGDAGSDTLVGGRGNDYLIGGSGDDYIEGRSGDDSLYGNEDNDTIYGGAGNDLLEGGDGNDDLDGGFDDDSLFGNEGADTLRGAEGSDLLDGGAGDDTIRFWFVLNDAFSTDTLIGGSNEDQVEIYGTDHSDTLTVDAIADTPGTFRVTSSLANFQFSLPTNALERDIETIRISGLGGDDNIRVNGTLNVGAVVIDGGEGDDTIEGSDAKDIIYGGGGADYLFGREGDDVIYGGEGDDQIFGGSGDDAIYGDGGNDTIDGGIGFDVIYGGTDDDTVYAGTGLDGGLIDGESGDDRLFGSEGIDHIYGGDGNDIIFGASHNDELYGGEGDDQISGGNGFDNLFGEAGNDTLFSVIDPDTATTSLSVESVDELLGVVANTPDVASNVSAFRELMLYFTEDAGNGSTYIQQNGQFVSLLEGLRPLVSPLEQSAIDSMLGELSSMDSIIDRLLGGDGDDNLVGSRNGDALIGGDGDNVIDGRGGYDSGDTGSGAIEFGGRGNQAALRVFQEHGVLTIQGTEQADSFTVSQSSFDGSVTIVQGGSTYVFNAVEGVSLREIVVQGLGGNDRIQAQGYFDVQLRIEGGDGRDLLWGSLSDDIIDGGAGSDLILGGDGNDELYGGLGDDSIQGGAGNDTLIGGEGKDSLKADDGNDELFALDASVDWISKLVVQPDPDATAGLSLAIAPNYTLDVVGGSTTLGDEVIENEIIDGGAGNDRLLGTNNRDNLIGGDGDDVILHTLGDDSVFGGLGSDRYEYPFSDASEAIHLALQPDGRIAVQWQNLDSGDPTVRQVILPDVNEIEVLGVEAAGGDDQFSLDFGVNAVIDIHLDGGNGNDFFEIGSAPTNIYVLGGEGQDHAEISTSENSPSLIANVNVVSGEATYTLNGLESLDLTGDANANYFELNSFVVAVNLFGLAGDDRFVLSGTGQGSIDGGQGFDTVAAHGHDFNVSDIFLKVTGENSQSLIDFDLTGHETTEIYANDLANMIAAFVATLPLFIDAGGGDDVIFGGHGDDTILAGDGNDFVASYAGADVIDGGNGNDSIYGGIGNDLLLGQGGEDEIYGDDGLDTVYGGDGDDTIYGDEGNDALYGDGGNDSIYGGLGDDLLMGHDGNDILKSGGGNDYIFGGDGDDLLYGGDGNDNLDGESGVDYLYGENGDDILQGGQDGERDYLVGGDGYDQGWQYFYRYGFLKLKKRWQESLSEIEEQHNINYNW
ncbi:calcium-binding protein [Stieleria sp. JC731]|uniref:calcium-binding protein n=1 Tax=Pirellulaceae TaxID=2691357 RepID=UPI0028F45504|nr:calcium-binding protein [Stieleria sp. JC731]